VILHMNLSLRGAWVLPFVRVRWVVAHGAQYRREGGRRFLRDHFKVWLGRRALNIACSHAILADLPPNATVIEHGYDDRVFEDRGAARDRDVLFVGRLVEGKGADLLIDALRLLNLRGLRYTCSVVGDGPERETLERASVASGLAAQVAFLGALSGSELRDVMNRHRVLVVPSRVEAFGIVAVEGLACGCAVLVSDVGGLTEAVGRCGLSFRSDDAGALAEALAIAHRRGPAPPLERSEHLARFSRRAVATRYIRAIQQSFAAARPR